MFLETLVMFGALLIFNLLSLSVLLLSANIRQLFDQLPAENLGLNFLFGIGAFSILQFLILILTTVVNGGLQGIKVLWGLLSITGGLGFLAWILASFLLPYLDCWNPSGEDGLDGRIALAMGLLWYFLSIGVGVFLLVVLSIAFFFPG